MGNSHYTIPWWNDQASDDGGGGGFTGNLTGDDIYTAIPSHITDKEGHDYGSLPAQLAHKIEEYCAKNGGNQSSMCDNYIAQTIINYMKGYRAHFGTDGGTPLWVYITIVMAILLVLVALCVVGYCFFSGGKGQGGGGGKARGGSISKSKKTSIKSSKSSKGRSKSNKAGKSTKSAKSRLNSKKSAKSKSAKSTKSKSAKSKKK